MKKTALTLALVLLSIATNAQTDKGVYFSLNTGYNLEANKQNNFIYFYGNPVFLVDSPSNTENSFTRFSLGKGINAQANIGYMFNQNIGLELGINYLLGGKTNFSSKNGNDYYQNTSISSKMLQFKPTLVLQTKLEKINPYVKLGAIIGTGSIFIDAENFDDPDLITLKETMNGGLAVGFHGNIGVSYPLNTKMAFFGELSLVSLNYAPTKGKFTEYTENGVDQLPSMDTNEKEFEFEDSVINFGNQAATEPMKLMRTTYSFSSIGFNVGLKYSLQ